MIRYQGFYVQDDGVMVVMEHCDCSLAGKVWRNGYIEL
jgi:hypothetical protein